MRTKETEKATRAPYRPLKQLRAFAEAIWLVTDETRKASPMKPILSTHLDYSIKIVEEKGRNGEVSVVAYAKKRGVKVARLVTLEDRSVQPTLKTYTVRVVYKSETFAIDATSRADALEQARAVLLEPKAIRQTVGRAHLIIKETK